MTQIRIIIPVYKHPEQLSKCLEHIEKQHGSSELYWHVQQVDNNQDNRGFTKAVNYGLWDAIEAEDEYAVILNQDCYLKPDALKEMVKFMDEHPKCAIAGIKQISSENTDLVIHGGCTEAYPNGRHIGGLVSKDDCSVDRQMPWVNGACLIVRVELIPWFGLMDENMFLVGSDSDWCYTARSRGWQVWYIAGASCVHEQGVTAGSADKKVQQQMYLDMIYWRNKWVGSDLYRELSMEIFD